MDGRFTIGFDREDDGRWIAEIVEVPGVLAYGRTQEDARSKVLDLLQDALEVVNELKDSRS